MADCGAGGTAMDRAASALMSTTAAGKHVSSLMGHAAMASSATTAGTSSMAMPMAPPTQLLSMGQHMQLQQGQHQQLQQQQTMMQHHHGGAAHVVANSTLDHAWHAPVVQQRTNPNGMVMQQQQQQQHYMIMQQQHQQQQHQHQQMMHMNMMMQQQHLQMQQQQQQRQQQQQQQQQQQNQSEKPRAKEELPLNLDEHWHDGLEDDFISSSIPEGATMKELAAAWAQAEAELDAAVNMAGAYGTVDEAAVEEQHPYHFQHPLEQHLQQQKDNVAASTTTATTTATSTATNDTSSTDWMEQGLQEYHRGNISAAIQSFEHLVQINDHHAKAWYYLGKCHAENDMDVQAIACLERSVERDPFAPDTLLALGVSYVNELNHTAALKKLKEWITHNPKYAGVQLSSDDLDLYGANTATTNQSDGAASSSTSTSFELDQVQRLLLHAMQHDDTNPNIQEALGVVYNVSRDYQAAVACFERALEQQPRDYSLWNKLGATLANSNASERALPAYQEALKLRPKYARAWLNMAISHSNLQDYEQAARCYLQTLSLNPAATHCWSYLRIALSCQEQWDMLPLVSNQDLNAFSEYYDFVLY